MHTNSSILSRRITASILLALLLQFPAHSSGEYIAMSMISNQQNKHFSELVLIERNSIKNWTKLTKFRYYLYKRQNWMANILQKAQEYELSRHLIDASIGADGLEN